MFLKVERRGGKSYGVLVHNYRAEGTIKQKRILALGALTDDEILSIKNWLACNPLINLNSISTTFEAIELVEPVMHGKVYIIRALWKKLQLDKVLKACGLSPIEIDLISIMVTNRCVEPSSKYHILTWLLQTSLSMLHHNLPSKLNENQLYRAMDSLYRNKVKLEGELWRHLQRMLKLDAKSVFYDITSTYFEGNSCELAAYGYSRDHRPDKLQVNLGIVLTEEMFPIMHEVYPGNTVDKATVEGICTRLHDELEVRNCTFIGDRGMITSDNIEILKRYGYRYIIQERNSEVIDIVAPMLARLKFKRVSEKLEVSEIILSDEEKLVVCRNLEKVKDDRRFREAQIKRGIQIIEEVKRSVESGRLVVRDKIFKRLIKKLSQKKLDHYFDLSRIPLVERLQSFECPLREDVIAREAIMDGIWVLRTDLLEKTGEELVRTYKKLNAVEGVFREIKSVLDLRPIYHRLADRVRAHAFLCVLSFLLLNYIEWKAKKNGMEITAERFLEKFTGVVRGHIELGVKKKVKVAKVSRLTVEQKALLGVIGLKPSGMESCVV